MSGLWSQIKSVVSEVATQVRLMWSGSSAPSPAAPPGPWVDTGGGSDGSDGGGDSGGADGGSDSGGADGGSDSGAGGGGGDTAYNWDDPNAEIWDDWDTAYPYVETEDQTCYAQKKGEKPVCYAKGGKTQEYTLIVQGLKCSASTEAPAPAGTLGLVFGISVVAIVIARRGR
ncbi:MAG: hypothetical protein JNM72_11935 [Deltaproteobacteria bacterium]|jgi:hypothetical protein|nr:hypothetical protein [Deltaproteobacteria bacterium]